MKVRNVGIFVFDDVQVLDFAGPFDVFTEANEIPEVKKTGQRAFNVFLIGN